MLEWEKLELRISDQIQSVTPPVAILSGTESSNSLASQCCHRYQPHCCSRSLHSPYSSSSGPYSPYSGPYSPSLPSSSPPRWPAWPVDTSRPPPTLPPDVLGPRPQSEVTESGVHIILRNQESSVMKILHIQYCPDSVAILIILNPPVCQKYPYFLKSLSANKFVFYKVTRIASVFNDYFT